MEGESGYDSRKRIRGFSDEPLDGEAFRDLIEAALTWLRTNSQTVNALNVFPVPDGDTGTNMVLTMQAAFDEIKNLPETTLDKIAHELAQGALMGARGNSGVILSQLWRGFARPLTGQRALTPALMASALSEARDTAYRGVVRPVEGTILTVSKDMAKAAAELADTVTDPGEMLELIVKAADESVARTPELLPVLKDAGVVDSGGKGLYYIFDGMLRYLQGLSLEDPEMTIQPLSALNLETSLQEIEEGQDYEVIVDFRPANALDLKKFYADLMEMGTSIQVGEGDGMYRMHIHVPTENRYEPIEYTMGIGTITKVYIENLMEQMGELELAAEARINLPNLEPGEIAVVAVSPGPGISRVFASLGVHAIIEGGQTMNPSTQEIIHSFENLPTNRVIILPNNKNILMSARAAAELTVKEVKVIPTTKIPQGLAAMLNFDPGGDIETMAAGMEAAYEDIHTGEVTTATRSIEIDGVQVEAGQIIALHNGQLVCASSSLMEGTLTFLRLAKAEDYELVTMFYGEDITPAIANQVADEIRTEYPELEIEVQDGGQPHYQFIFYIE